MKKLSFAGCVKPSFLVLLGITCCSIWAQAQVAPEGAASVAAETVAGDSPAMIGQTSAALAWGNTFAIGAVLNSALVGLGVYLLLRLLYERTRPAALVYFRRHAQEHQRKFSLHQQSNAS